MWFKIDHQSSLLCIQRTTAVTSSKHLHIVLHRRKNSIRTTVAAKNVHILRGCQILTCTDVLYRKEIVKQLIKIINKNVKIRKCMNC